MCGPPLDPLLRLSLANKVVGSRVHCAMARSNWATRDQFRRSLLTSRKIIIAVTVLLGAAITWTAAGPVPRLMSVVVSSGAPAVKMARSATFTMKPGLGPAMMIKSLQGKAPKRQL